jgi:hypothetical protein
MKVINPNNTNHTLKIVPRFYEQFSVLIEFKNEETKEFSTLNVTPTILKGYMILNFSKTFFDKDNLQIKITNSTGKIVYRGKLFITSQSTKTQEYKMTKDVFNI